MDRTATASDLTAMAKGLIAADKKTLAFRDVKKKLMDADRALKALDDGSSQYKKAYDKLMDAHDAFDAFKRTASKSKVAGHEDRYFREEAWSRGDAYAQAEREMERDSRIDYWTHEKTEVLREPKKATKVKVDKMSIKKGPVNKVFTIRTSYGDESGGLKRDRRYTAHYKTQGAVIKAAKELALEYGERLMIQLEAFCVGNTNLAVVTPSGGRPGLYGFEFDVHV